jgi:hypothetical protein
MKTSAMKTLLILLLPLAAEAQLAIVSVAADGTEVPITSGSAYQYGPVAIGTTATALFRVYNHGTSLVPISTVTTGGMGFTTAAAPALPYSIPAGSTMAQALNVWVYFTPTAAALSFSSPLTITSTANAISLFVQGTGVSAPTLTSVSGCSGGASFAFGNVKTATPVTCTFSIQSPNSPVTIASIVVNGLGFTGPYGVTMPLTLATGQSASFSITFTPPAATVYTGSLVITIPTSTQPPLTQTFALSGTGEPPPIPTPVLQFNSGTAASAQQRTLTMTIPGGSPVAVTGYVNLTFTPSTAAVKDDSEIVFLANGSRTIPFSAAAGATTALLNGQSSAAFQTGTTEGTLTFTLTTAAAITGNPTVALTIPGTSVIIDSTSASKERTGYLDITIIGADNTYSVGAMSFAFFDTSGNAIGSAVSANFISSFKTYYGGQTGGSAFQSLVSFPVTGSVATIGSVTVTLTNAAGTASTGSLTFQ